MTIPPKTTRGRLIAAALSGVLLGITFPNFSFVLLLPVALLPLMLAVEGASIRAASLAGALFGLVFWLTTIPWIAYTIHRYGEVPRPVAVIALLLAALLLVPPFALLTALVAAAAPRSGPGFVLTWTAAWVVQEGFRTYLWVFGGFPWALLAYPLADYPEWIQSAAFGGVLLTSALVAALNAVLFLALRARDGRARLRAFVAAAALVVAAALPAARKAAPDATPGTRWLRAGVVQPNVSQELRWSAEERERIYRDLLEGTRQLVTRSVPPPRLVLWPESASPLSWSWSERYRRDVTALCRELDVAILLSTAYSDEPANDDAPYYNAALLVTKDGPVLPPYFKVRLVPFGEYVPLGALLRKIRPISRAVPGSFTPGARPGTIAFDGLKLGGAVCYEVVYPWILRTEARDGADVLFTLTNDAWYGTLGARRQHWQAAVFRAVETGRPLLRAAVTGISGAIDARGAVLERIGPDEKGSFVADLRLSPGTAPAVRAGDLVLAVCVAGLFAGILRRRAFPPRKPAAA